MSATQLKRELHRWIDEAATEVQLDRMYAYALSLAGGLEEEQDHWSTLPTAERLRMRQAVQAIQQGKRLTTNHQDVMERARTKWNLK